MNLTKNLANKMTLFRILSIPLLMYLLLAGMEVAALVLFVIASITDFVDGYVARRQNSVSTFGKFADPIADKLLVSAVFVTFIQLGELSAIPVVIILAREFIVTGLRLVAMAKEKVVAASWMGKTKTISHIVLIISIMVTRNWNWELSRTLKPTLVYVAVGLTLISGLDYLYRNKNILREEF